jgi:hypothetical protein
VSPYSYTSACTSVAASVLCMAMICFHEAAAASNTCCDCHSSSFAFRTVGCCCCCCCCCCTLQLAVSLFAQFMPSLSSASSCSNSALVTYSALQYQSHAALLHHMLCCVSTCCYATSVCSTKCSATYTAHCITHHHQHYHCCKHYQYHQHLHYLHYSVVQHTWQSHHTAQHTVLELPTQSLLLHKH